VPAVKGEGGFASDCTRLYRDVSPSLLMVVDGFDSFDNG
jgi:hypothetical protein